MLFVHTKTVRMRVLEAPRFGASVKGAVLLVRVRVLMEMTEKKKRKKRPNCPGCLSLLHVLPSNTATVVLVARKAAAVVGLGCWNSLRSRRAPLEHHHRHNCTNQPCFDPAQ
jgi:hypothetical protein